jgi:hypothetical protein
MNTEIAADNLGYFINSETKWANKNQIFRLQASTPNHIDQAAWENAYCLVIAAAEMLEQDDQTLQLALTLLSF